MRRLVLVSLGAFVLLGCGDSGVESVPGAIVDNFEWTPTTAGEEFFGTPPEGATCPLEPEGDCPIPDGECVDLPPGGNCVVSFIAECLQGFTVLSVYTQRPSGSALCNWITLEQPLLRDIAEGDEVEIRAFHFPLNAPFGGEARIGFVIGDEKVFETTIAIPQVSGPFGGSWIATKDVPAGTPVLFHVDNHGDNEYLLIEANICNEREPGDPNTPCFL